MHGRVVEVLQTGLCDEGGGGLRCVLCVNMNRPKACRVVIVDGVGNHRRQDSRDRPWRAGRRARSRGRGGGRQRKCNHVGVIAIERLEAVVGWEFEHGRINRVERVIADSTLDSRKRAEEISLFSIWIGPDGVVYDPPVVGAQVPAGGVYEVVENLLPVVKTELQSVQLLLCPVVRNAETILLKPNRRERIECLLLSI